MTFLYKEKMIFVVGNSRSGTTMMAKLLSKSGKVHFFGEIHFFEQLWNPEEKSVLNVEDAKKLAKKLYAIENEGYLKKIKNLEKWEENAEKLIQHLIDNNMPLYPYVIFGTFLVLEAKRHNREIPCDQTPRNVFYIKEILEYFPEAKIINMIRDPRDVLLSQKYKWRLKFAGLEKIPYHEVVRSWLNYNPITISKLWTSSIYAYQKHAHEDRVLNVYFEQLLSFPEKEIRKICDFLEIPFEEEMLYVEQIHSSTEDNKQVKKGLDKTKIGKWKRGGLNNTEIYICQKIAKDLMKKHNYDFADVKPNIFLLAYYGITFPLKLSLALIMNLDRMKSLKNAIKRRLKKA